MKFHLLNNSPGGTRIPVTTLTVRAESRPRYKRKQLMCWVGQGPLLFRTFPRDSLPYPHNGWPFLNIELSGSSGIVLSLVMGVSALEIRVSGNNVPTIFMADVHWFSRQVRVRKQ